MEIAETPKYKRLMGRSGLSRQRVYLGDDHVLVVDGFLTETYRRFYFRDIEAIMLRKTASGLIVFIILAVLLFPFVFMMFSPGIIARRFGIVFAATLFILLAANTLEGPTCSCRFITAVQSERLTSIVRLRKAHKILQQVLPRIQAAQGEFDPLALRRQLARRQAPLMPPPLPEDTVTPDIIPEPPE